MSKGFETAASSAVQNGAAAAGAATELGAIALVVGATGPIGGIVFFGTGAAGKVGEGATGFVDAFGKSVFGWLGLDWVTSGKTSDGKGTWNQVDHPDGSGARTIDDDGMHSTETWDGKGGYTDHVHTANGFDSTYSDDGHGDTHYEAHDTGGGSHTIDTSSDGRSTADSDGHGNWTVTANDGQGNSSYIHQETDDDGSTTTTERNTSTDKDGNTTTTTSVTEKDKDGNVTSTSTETEKKDKDGNPIDGGGQGGEADPETGTDEGTRLGPGSLGRPRPGHPQDPVLGGVGSGGDPTDDYHNEPVTLRQAMAAMGLLVGTNGDPTDAPEGDDPASMRRRLREISVRQLAQGEDYINPRARGQLTARIGAAMAAGLRLP